MAGVDIVRSNRGPLIIEVNASPGLEGVGKATKMDVASKIIEFIENRLTKNNSKQLKRLNNLYKLASSWQPAKKPSSSIIM